MDDWQLLQDYIERGSEAAFRALVSRHLNLVHAAALRQVNDRQLAEEISQAVFILLARRAGSFRQGVVLAGWLFRTTRFVAARALRSEQRRQRREQEAFEMQQLTTPDDNWRRIAPVLDEALARLGETDRNAVLLRFMQDKNHREVGTALGLNEEAAKKRVARALEKLRAFFVRRGFTLSVTVLASALAANATKAAPASLANSVVAAAVSGGAAATAALSAIVTETLAAWRWAKVKLAGASIAGGVLIVGLVMNFLSHRSPEPASAASVLENAVVSDSASNDSPSKPVVFSNTRQRRTLKNVLRFQVVAADNGEPVANARLAVSFVTPDKWDERFDFMTDDAGTCELPLPLGLGHLDAGIAASGWEARFAAWKLDTDKEFPTEYTLRVQRVTNWIGGWLRDETGKPAAGAEIWMQFGGGGDASWRETPRERRGFFGDVPIAKTDRDGRWTCAVIPPDNDRYYSLKARHADFAPADIEAGNPSLGVDDSKRATFQQLWAGSLVTILKRGVSLAGRVTDDAGNPIPQAKISHQPCSTDAKSFDADAKGQFTISNLSTGKYPITITASGFAPEYRIIDMHPGIEPIAVQLKPGAQLLLSIVDKHGVEVPGATVTLEQWGEDRHVLDWRVKSRTDGRIVWDSAPRDAQLILCAHKDGWCYTRDVRLVADGAEHTITLLPELKLSGNVTDAETGLPIPEFKAFPGYGEGPGTQVWERLRTQRGQNGLFKMQFEEAEQPWRVRVEADGYEPAVSEPLATDSTGTLEIKLKRAELVRGLVLLPDGKPAANAQVALLTLDYDASLERAKFRDNGESILTNADAQGFFEFPPEPRAHSVAAVSEAGFAKLRLLNSNNLVTLRLQPWGRIEGMVAESARAQPIDSVVLMDDTAMNYRGAVTLNINSFMAKLDSAGQFSFEQVPGGQFSLYLNRGMGIPLSCQTDVIVRSGETAVAQIGGRGWTAVGRFSAEPGRIKDWVKQTTYATFTSNVQALPEPPGLTEDAAALWAVNFWQSEAGINYYRQNRSFSVIVAADGSFRIGQLKPGTYKLAVLIDDAYFTKDVRIEENVADTNKEVKLGTFDLPAKNQ